MIMGWMQKCCETYENNSALAGRSGDRDPLCPISHMNATAQIEITLDSNGNFVSAASVDKENGRTIIPVTESSASRSSGIAPHSLCDTLPYVAGDYALYVESDKEKKRAWDKFEAYLEQLRKWNDSDYSCRKVNVIYTYVAKRNMLHDLIETGLVELDNGFLSNKKIFGKAYADALVRFKVHSEVGTPDGVWQDKVVIDRYIDYVMQMLPGKINLCYVSGRISVSSENHPKGIVSANYGAKLLSANDKTDFTYRGRFQVSEQAYSVSYEASQKAHNALRWVIANQGESIGNTDKRTFVCWSPKGKKTISLIKNPLLRNAESDDLISGTKPEYRKKLHNTLLGYRDELEKADDIIVMGLDAATTGRLSITYYNELAASDFYDRIEYWYSTLNWYFRRYIQNVGYVNEIRTPSMKEIVRYAYGTEDDSGRMIVNDKLMKGCTQRLIYCMLERQPIPKDIMHSLFWKASYPQKNSSNMHEKILSTACAVIVKSQVDIFKSKTYDKEEEKVMVLDEHNTNRSYLFGRMLAIAEVIERSAFTNDEKREPSAMRYQSVYVNHPMATWTQLEDLLTPYYARLDVGLRLYYKNMIGSIFALLCEKDKEELNRPLDENYLIGYYLQRNSLYAKKSKSSE